MQEKKEIIVDSVFIEADYLECRNISNQSFYVATCTAGDFRTALRVRLRPSLRYQEQLEKLYHYFIANGIPWMTVNHPYLAKFYDVVCVRMDVGTTEAPDIPAEIQFDFKQHSQMIKKEIIPIWNIEHLNGKSVDFPMPALDKINYEYYFALQEEAAQDGYLMEYSSDSISAMRREENQLVITSPIKSELYWNMLRLYQKTPSITEQFYYPLYDNRQEDSFAGRMITHYGTSVKTKAELFRIIQSYSASKFLILRDFYITNNHSGAETWEANVFLKDEIRDPNAARTMILQFEPVKKNHFLNRDIMSFLTSQVQLIYPEYHCMGVLT